MAVIATVAVFQWHNATVQRNQAQARFRQATSLRLVSEARGMLARARPGGDARALEQLLAARPLTATPDDGPLYSAVVQRVTTDKIIETPDQNRGVAFSPDGHRLASGSHDKTMRLWDADTGQPIGAPLTGHTDVVYDVAFSPDGHRLASASRDRTVRLWNADTGQPIGAPLTGHTAAVTSVAFSPDGHRLASAGGDGTVRLWNADTGQPIGGPADRTHRLGGRAWRLAPTGTGWPPPAPTARCGCGTPTPANPSAAPLTGHTNSVFERGV